MIVKDMSIEDKNKFDAQLDSVRNDEEARKARQRQIDRERQARAAL